MPKAARILSRQEESSTKSTAAPKCRSKFKASVGFQRCLKLLSSIMAMGNPFSLEVYGWEHHLYRRRIFQSCLVTLEGSGGYSLCETEQAINLLKLWSELETSFNFESWKTSATTKLLKHVAVWQIRLGTILLIRVIDVVILNFQTFEIV